MGVGKGPKNSGTLGPHSLGQRSWLTPRNTLLPYMCQHTKFCRSRSHRFDVVGGPIKFSGRWDVSHAAWRRSIVVRTLVSAGELSLSCARLLAG